MSEHFNIQSQTGETIPDQPAEDNWDLTPEHAFTREDGAPETLAPQERQEEERGVTIPVRFNHEDLNIPLAEAVPLIQKGLNYDRLLPRLLSDESLDQQFDDFARAFPDIARDPESIAPEVWEDVRQGMPLREAYLRQENKRLTALLAREQAREAGRRLATPSARGRGSGGSHDHFLLGFETV